MILTARFLLIPALVTVLVAAGGVAAAAYADEATVTIHVIDKDNTKACATVAAFEKNASTAFDAAASNHVGERTQLVASRMGAKPGFIHTKDLGDVHVIETADGMDLLFDERGWRIAVGTHEKPDAPIAWHDGVGMSLLRCE